MFMTTSPESNDTILSRAEAARGGQMFASYSSSVYQPGNRVNERGQQFARGLRPLAANSEEVGYHHRPPLSQAARRIDGRLRRRDASTP